MNQSDQNNIFQSSLPYQRRTLSIDEYSLQIMNNEYDGLDDKYSKKTLTNGKNEIKKQNSNDYYMCAALPRTNNRPSAKTCWRNRSIFAPSPKSNFGPKATLKRVPNNEQVVLQDPSSQRLHWISPPNNILIIRKPEPSILPEFRILVGKVLKRCLTVYIEDLDRAELPLDADLKEHSERCVSFDEDKNLFEIDLIICLGGDGTLLHVSSLFQKSCPPILSFSMGSLGFLTPFDFKFHEKILNEVLAGDVPVLLRSRLSCKIVREQSNNIPVSNSSDLTLQPDDKIITNNDNDTDHLVLNEVVIDRGPNSYLSNVDLYINDRFITKVQGDGLIISTPTGSTAYAMAAGASMVHPNVPAIVICPICPHSLSFRPIVVPAGIELTVKVSEDARRSAWLSIDGRNRLELNQTNSVKITSSVYPVPSICRFDQLGDWFESLADILHWNLRKAQTDFDINQETESDEHSQNQDDENSVDEQVQSPTDDKTVNGNQNLPTDSTENSSTDVYL